MNRMIVGIDYLDSGERTISHLSYKSDRNEKTFKEMSRVMSEIHDEAYIVDFNPNCTDFINEIVTKGCRI